MVRSAGVLEINVLKQPVKPTGLVSPVVLRLMGGWSILWIIGAGSDLLIDFNHCIFRYLPEFLRIFDLDIGN